MLLRGMRLSKDLRLFVEDLTVFATFRHILKVSDMVLYLRLCMSNIRGLCDLWEFIICSLVVHPCLVFVLWNYYVLVMSLIGRTRGNTLMLHNHIVLLFFRNNSPLNNLARIFFHWLLKLMWRQFGLLATSILVLWRSKLHLNWSFILMMVSLWGTVVWVVLLMMKDLGLTVMGYWFLVSKGKLRFVLIDVAITVSSAIPVQLSMVGWANIAHWYITVPWHSISDW